MTDRELAHLFLGVALVRALAYSTLCTSRARWRRLRRRQFIGRLRRAPLAIMMMRRMPPREGIGFRIAALGKSATMKELAI